MRAGAIILILCILLSASFVSAVSTTLNSQYQQSETMIARIDGAFLNNINTGDIEFKRGTVRVPFQFDVKKLGNDFYIWAITPQTAGDYTMYIYNLQTQTQQQTFTYSQNFSVAGNGSDYYVTPGFVISNGIFSIDVVLNADSSQTITADFPTSRTITLSPGDNNIAFDASGQADGLHFLNLGSYQIPVWLNTGIAAPVNESTNSTTENVSQNGTNPQIILVVSPNPLNKLAYYGGMPAYGFTIYNNGNADASNVQILYNSGVIQIIPNSGISVPAGSSYSFNASFIVPLNDSVRQNITIESDSGNITVPMHIDITNNSATLLDIYAQSTTDSATNVTTVQSNYYCSELSGNLCPGSTTCSGQIVNASNGPCCIGSCVAQSSGGGSSWIGWLIAGIVVLAVAFLWAKYKGVKPAVPKIG